MSVPDGCLVRIPGAGLCGWGRDGRHLECAAHRRRLRVHGDYLAHVPVTRKPSRRPEDVAARRHAAAVAARLAIRMRDEYAARHRAERRGTLELA